MKGGTRRIKRTGKGNKTKKFGGAPGKSRAAISNRMQKLAKTFKKKVNNTLARQKNDRYYATTMQRLLNTTRKRGKANSMDVDKVVKLLPPRRGMTTRTVTVAVAEAKAAAAAAAAAAAKATDANEDFMKILEKVNELKIK